MQTLHKDTMTGGQNLEELDRDLSDAYSVFVGFQCFSE